MSQVLLDHINALIGEVGANKPSDVHKAELKRVKGLIEGFRKQRCYECGGYGHRDGMCGFKKRLYAVAGRTEFITNAVNGAFKKEIMRRGELRRKEEAMDYHLIARHAPANRGLKRYYSQSDAAKK